jgi:hypothetical protein
MKVSRAKSGWTLTAAIAMVVGLASCGGSEGTQQQPPPPPPPALAIITTTLPGSFYSEFYTATLEASGGTGARTWSISSGALPAGLNLDTTRGVISGVLSNKTSGTIQLGVTVRDTAAGVASRTFDLSQGTRAARILTTRLPDAVIGRPYQVQLATTQPNDLIAFDLTQGLPPAWLSTGPSQTLSGTATAPAGQFNFVVQLFSGSGTVQQAFTLNVVGQGTNNRNEDTANAPLISSGTYFASISPLTDPATSLVANPDHDFYRMTAQPGSVVSIEITAERNSPRSPLDAVIELVDSAGTRLTTCDVPGQSGFTTACMNDDNTQENTLDSKLVFRAPTGAPSTFFLHVLDWRGDGRPDLLYSFQVFGAD